MHQAYAFKKIIKSFQQRIVSARALWQIQCFPHRVQPVNYATHSLGKQIHEVISRSFISSQWWTHDVCGSMPPAPVKVVYSRGSQAGCDGLTKHHLACKAQPDNTYAYTNVDNIFALCGVLSTPIYMSSRNGELVVPWLFWLLYSCLYIIATVV